MSKEKGVAIRIKPDTRRALRALGMKGETYDDVVQRLILEGAEAKDQLVSAWTMLEDLMEKREEVEG